MPAFQQSCEVERPGTVLDTREAVGKWGSSPSPSAHPSHTVEALGRERPHGSVIELHTCRILIHGPEKNGS